MWRGRAVTMTMAAASRWRVVTQHSSYDIYLCGRDVKEGRMRSDCNSTHRAGEQNPTTSCFCPCPRFSTSCEAVYSCAVFVGVCGC